MKIKKYLDTGLDVLFLPKRRLGAIEQEILQQLSAGDLLIGFLCSARSSRRMYRTAFERARARYAVKKAVKRLQHDGFVAASKNGDEIMLTSIGRSVVMREVEILRSSQKCSRKRWDGHWRIVSFDIPKEYRTTRNALRQLLKRAGFRQVQKSVYMFPYQCDELVALLREDRRLAEYTFFCTADTVTSVDLWKTRFGMK